LSKFILLLAASRRWHDDLAPDAGGGCGQDLAVTRPFMPGYMPWAREGRSMQSLKWLPLCCAGALLASCREATAPESGAEVPNAAASESVTPLALSNTWGTKARMPYARSGIPAATINGVIYVVGGSSSSAYLTTTLQAYNIATNTWATRKSLPVAHTDLNGASVINGRLYVTGGYGERTLFVYDPGTNTWTRKADMPDEGFYGAQGVINGRLYVYAAATFGPPKLFRYNPVTNTWVTRRAPYVVQSQPAAGVIGGKFYVAGGEDDLGRIIPDLEVYDPATDTWTAKAPMPVPLKAMASAVINGKLYVAGGWRQFPAPDYTAKAVATLLVYDPATDRWTTKAPMPTPRAYAAGAAASGKFFVLGGINATGTLRKVEAYSP
jgi:N-acetylneuraminic acid mutarotase